MKKNKFCILTDSSINSPEFINDIDNLYIYPLKMSINNKEYNDDGKDLTFEALYELQKNYFVKTSQGSIKEFENFIKDLLNKYEKIYFFSMGKYFSGLADNVKLFSQNYKDKLLIIKTDNIYIGLYYAIKNALQLIKKDSDINKIQKATDEFLKNSYYVFTLDNSSYLAKSGRISKLTGFLTNILKIKVIFKYNNSQTNIVGTVRTLMTAWDSVLIAAKEIAKNVKDPVFNFVSSSINDEKIKNYFLKTKQILNSNIKGPFQLSVILASHMGPETFGIFINPKINY